MATITLTSVEDPTAYGLVEVDSDMQVHRFLEKPAYDEVTSNLVNAGIYPGQLLEVELDDGVYEVEILRGDGVVVELDYDARSGKLLKTELDD